MGIVRLFNCARREVVTMNRIKLVLIFTFTACNAQLKFGSSGGSTSSSNSKNQQGDTDTRIFTGNAALDGGLVGLGAGLLGGAVLTGALNGNNNNGYNNGCGRRRRQADGTQTKFLGALLGGGS